MTPTSDLVEANSKIWEWENMYREADVKVKLLPRMRETVSSLRDEVETLSNASFQAEQSAAELGTLTTKMAWKTEECNDLRRRLDDVKCDLDQSKEQNREAVNSSTPLSKTSNPDLMRLPAPDDHWKRIAQTCNVNSTISPSLRQMTKTERYVRSFPPLLPSAFAAYPA